MKVNEEEKKEGEKFCSHRPGVDLICVIDNSGGMGGQKISLVKDTLKKLCDQPVGELFERTIILVLKIFIMANLV